jgi:hypothetical protein
MGLPSTFDVKVVGVSFVPGYPNNIFALNDAAAARFLTQPGDLFEDSTPEPLPATLVRNPLNEYDQNAIEVHVPSLTDHDMIGHLPAAIASRLAPLLDAGERWGVVVKLVAIDPNHPTNPGILLHVKRLHVDEPF